MFISSNINPFYAIHKMYHLRTLSLPFCIYFVFEISEECVFTFPNSSNYQHIAFRQYRLCYDGKKSYKYFLNKNPISTR